jgi:hypothetical protein
MSAQYSCVSQTSRTKLFRDSTAMRTDVKQSLYIESAACSSKDDDDKLTIPVSAERC